ncbi:MAG: MarR family winged helix-turn-helix transcriptional regulator [Pseudomonadota bacterium]
MIDQTANLLGAVALAVSDRIHATARQIVSHSGETPAALVVIGYGTGPSNDQLRRILRLSHPGTVRLVDRLVKDGLVERKKGQDRRAVALHLTPQGSALREQLLSGRLAAVRPFVEALPKPERETLSETLRSMLKALEPSDEERQSLCRMCDNRVCTNCPIPAQFHETQ